jgi:enterobactin synthetase component D
MHVVPSSVLPPWASQVRLFLEHAIPSEVARITLPRDLERAVPRRQLLFRAGRYCAMKAMETLGHRFEACEVGRAENGAPLWPEGAIGSITHTDDLVSAAVALTTDVEALGIDTERVVSGSRAREIARLVTRPDEAAYALAAGMSESEAFTLVFSAKESIFKCLHPMTGEFMDFHDVRIDGVDRESRTFSARLMRTLSPRFPAHTVVEGRFEIEAPWLHTAVTLPSNQITGSNDRRLPTSRGHRTLA